MPGQMHHFQALFGVLLLAASAAQAQTATCALQVSAKQGDTCASLASSYGITVGQFISWNSGMPNCMLTTGSNYCVKQSSVISSFSAVAPTATTISSPDGSDGVCGPIGTVSGLVYTCLGSVYGDCCSVNGYCGNETAYCGDGCNPLYGRCGNGVDPSLSTSATVTLGPTRPVTTTVTVTPPPAPPTTTRATTTVRVPGTTTTSTAARPSPTLFGTTWSCGLIQRVSI